MTSCFGLCRKQRDEAHEPLLPQYHDDTALQARLHQKLHTYQMLRALVKGFMPSTEQAIVQLRTLLASDVLNPDDTSLSESGRLLVKHTKQCLRQVIDLLHHKNAHDELQDFLWLLTQSRLSVDTSSLSRRLSKTKSKANAEAAYKSVQTIGSLLLTNSEFRRFLADLQLVGREVFKDSAATASRVAEDISNEVDPQLGSNGIANASGGVNEPPSQNDLLAGAQEFSTKLTDGATKVGIETQESLIQHLSGQEKETLLKRLQAAVGKLRQRGDYSEATSTFAMLIKRYALAYSKALEDTVEAAHDDTESNREAEMALQNFWSLMTSFGDREEWNALQTLAQDFIQRHRQSPDFEKFVTEIADTVQKMLTDPSYFDERDGELSKLQSLYKRIGNETSLDSEIRGILKQAQQTYQSVIQDQDVAKLYTTALRLVGIFSPNDRAFNQELLQDVVQVFGPLLIQAVQYVPIPRLEVSVPEIDLLLENLVIEPGKTINNTSFLPFRLKAETYNEFEIRKAHTRTTSRAASLLTIKIDGLSLRADEVGYWLRAHSGLVRLADEGIASFRLDERGIDIHLDVEIGQDRLEKIVSLKAVRVHVHKLSYVLRKSKFSILAWLLKPILRPIVRKVMEKQLANAIADLIHFANRELLYTRERLRATRIADPQDIATFFKAIMTRLTPTPDPDVYTRLGVDQPGGGVFKGVYAPGSVVKLWNEQAARAPEIIEDFDRGGWRNDIFDVTTRVPG